MDRLEDFIGWMGDFSFSQTGFLDADALVLAALAYVDFGPICEGGGTPRLRDCLGMLSRREAKVLIVGSDADYLKLLSLAASSKRYGNLRLANRVDVIRGDPPLQFAAICFLDDEGPGVLAYRGTDSSLAGWKEDFMISFTRTEAQELARDYAEEHLDSARRWYVAGHSKGGNLALYAACTLSERALEHVERFWLLDGPGLCPEVMDLSCMARLNGRATQVLPRFSIVGRLFAPEIADTRIVRSTATGFRQHGISTWGVDHGKLALAEGFDPVSLWFNSVMDAWIGGISQADRVALVEELFDALSVRGAESLVELSAGGAEAVETVLRRLRESSPVARRLLGELPKYAVKTGIHIRRND